MKKIFLVLLVAAVSENGFAQSFDKGNRNFDFKLDFARYKETITDNQTLYTVHPTARSFVFTPQMTWGIGKKMSIGASLTYSHYLDSAQSLGSNPKLNGLDANFLFDFHFMRSSKIDMMAGLKLGIAGVRSTSNDGSGDVYGSMGRVYDIHFAARFYVSEKIGILANLAFSNYKFNKFGRNLDYTSTIAFRGFCIGTGIAINLTPKKE